MNRYYSLKTNTSSKGVLVMDTQASSTEIINNVLHRIRAGTGLLQALTGVTIKHTEDEDFYKLIICAYLPLQDGLDMLEQFVLNSARPDQPS